MSSISGVSIPSRDASSSLPQTFSSTECSESPEPSQAVKFEIVGKGDSCAPVKSVFDKLTELAAKIRAITNVDELANLLIPIRVNPEFKGVISEYNYRRIWNLFQQKDLFRRAESPHEIRCFRDLKLDLQWETFPELKEGCSNIIADEKEALSSKIWEDDSVLVDVRGQKVGAFPDNPSFSEEQLALRQKMKQRVEGASHINELKDILEDVWLRSDTDLIGVLSRETLQKIYCRFGLRAAGFPIERSSSFRVSERLRVEFPPAIDEESFIILRDKCAALFA